MHSEKEFFTSSLRRCSRLKRRSPVDDVVGKPEGPSAWILAAVEQPRGLVRNEPGATPGYVLITQFPSDKTYLLATARRRGKERPGDAGSA